jgi:hypothetical protein
LPGRARMSARAAASHNYHDAYNLADTGNAGEFRIFLDARDPLEANVLPMSPE